MQIFEIIDIKKFTDHLFVGTLFDGFFMTEAAFTTFATTILDGTIKPSFFDTEQQEIIKEQGIHYVFWKDMKSIAIAAIRGKTLPQSFHIILRLNQKDQNHSVFSDLPHNNSSFFLNIKFKNNKLTCTTGTSVLEFQVGAKPDVIWDHAIVRFFRENKIEFEML